MEEQLARIDRRLARLERVVRDLEMRVAVAERLAPAGGAEMPDTPAVSPEGEPRAPASADITGPLALVGRTFLIFAGAYLLRALVESEALPAALGVLAGLGYALACLGWADRAAARQPLAGSLYGAAAVAIAYPLVWEATTRFQLLGAPASAAVLALVTAVAFAVAARQHLQAVAWATTIAVIGAAAALLVQTGSAAPFAVCLVAVGIATLWLAYEWDWYALRWPAAVAANLAVLGVTSRALTADGLDHVATALVLQFLLLGGYLASIAARTLVRGRNVIVFEVLQTPAALAVGLGGAVAVAHRTGAGGLPLGVAALALGGACYAVAFAFVDRRQGLGRNFYFYTSLGLVLTLTGAAVLLQPTPLVVTWSAAGLVTAWCGWRFSRAALTLHAAVYLVAAAVTSGLLVSTEAAFFGSAGGAWPRMGASAWIVLAAAAGSMLIARDPRDLNVFWRMPRVVVGLLLVAGIGTVVLGLAVPRLAGTPGGGCDAGMLATIRTGVVALAAVALAWAGRTTRLLELRWLLYPVLVGGGLKLLLEDLRYSRPATLFIALALYGGALILAPRVGRPAPRAAASAAAEEPLAHT